MPGMLLSSKDSLPLYKTTLDPNKLPVDYSYREFVSSVKDQGNSPCCVPYSISQIIEWYWRGMSGKKVSFDTKRLYNLRSNKGQDGMTFRDAFNILKSYGYTLDGIPGQKILGYVSLSSEVQMKDHLVSYSPFLLGLPVYESSGNSFWIASGKLLGYHAVVATGYDKSGLQILNSWGSAYGSGGYSKLLWRDFSSIKEAWGIVF